MLHLECKPDEVLARKLGRTSKQCRHHNDKGRVCKFLQRDNGSVGMIDEDPGAIQPRYLATLSLEVEKHDVRVLRDEKRGHRLVILCPRLEEWLIKTAAESDLSLAEFGLSTRGNELHREINSRLSKIEELLAALLKVRSQRLLYLQKLIVR